MEMIYYYYRHQQQQQQQHCRYHYLLTKRFNLFTFILVQPPGNKSENKPSHSLHQAIMCNGLYLAAGIYCFVCKCGVHHLLVCDLQQPARSVLILNGCTYNFVEGISESSQFLFKLTPRIIN